MKINFKTGIFIGVVTALLVMITWARSLALENQELLNKYDSTHNQLIVAQDNLSATKEQLDITTADLRVANEVIDAMKDEEYIVGFTVTNTEIDMIAKTVYGEARGCSTLEQSAVVWCILNRVDAGWGSIAEVVTAPNQFHGYSRSFPVTDDIRMLVEDVVARWKLEKLGCGNVGRTLPNYFLYFVADGTGIGNIFRTSWNGGERWNWDCWNPYS